MKIDLVVGNDAADSRIDRYLADALPQFSRTRIQQLIRAGFIKLNGTTTRSRNTLQPGDRIELIEPPPQTTENRPEPIPLDVLFEDEDVLVVNKPPGLVVHPGVGHHQHTLVNALLHHSPTLSIIGGKERPGIVHRLDKETSGCLVVAKNDHAHHSLSEQFATRTVEKIYLALVAGKIRKTSGVIEAQIGRHPVHRQRMMASATRGRSARTEYRVARSTDRASLLECRLHTGRTHQVRVHLHHLGHPVLGDTVYAPRLAKSFPRQMLHAWKVGFQHPRTGEWRNFEAPLPQDFAAALQSTGMPIV